MRLGLLELLIIAFLLAVPVAIALVVWLAHRGSPGPQPQAVSIPAGSYVVVALGHEYGPYDADRLLELVRSGHVTPVSTLRLDGGRPFPAAELTTLFRR